MEVDGALKICLVGVSNIVYTPKGFRCPRGYDPGTSPGAPRDIPARMSLGMFPSEAPKLIFGENTVEIRWYSL